MRTGASVLLSCRVALVVAITGCYYSSAPQQQQPYRIAYASEPPSPNAPEQQGEPFEVAADTAPNQDKAPNQIAVASGDALVRLGSQRERIGPASVPQVYSRICVQDQARIDVDDTAELVLTSDQATVIGGRGIGPSGSRRATIKIVAHGAPEIFVLFDNAAAPIDAVFDAPRATVNIGITGKTGLKLDGKIGTSIMNASWGLPPSFPACDATMDREKPPSFPPSVDRPGNCVGRYKSSNYVTPQQGKRELHVIGVYEGNKHVDGTVVVRVAARPVPIVLALGAYQPTIWKLEVAPGARIAAIYTYGYNAQKLVDAPVNARVVELASKHYAYGWEPAANSGGGGYLQLMPAVRKATGLHESSFQGCYAGNTFDVP